MEIWIVVAKSCVECNCMAVGTFDHEPTEEEINNTKEECGGMFCIRTYIVATKVNSNPTEIEME